MLVILELSEFKNVTNQKGTTIIDLFRKERMLEFQHIFIVDEDVYSNTFITQSN